MILFYFFAFFLFHASAQSFPPNPLWKNPNIITSPDERIAIAKNGIEQTLSSMVDANGQLKLEDGNYGVAGRFFSQMAQFDMATKQMAYKELVLNFLKQALSFRPDRFIQGNMNWGLEHSIAASHAYAIYSDPSFLDLAVLAWSGASSYTLTADEVRTGKVFGKNITVKSVCAGLTMAGGTFWINDPKSSYVNALGVGSYLIATSLLAETTKNQTYIDTAISSASFFFNHLLNSPGELLDGINADTCTPTDNSFPANYGLMIEGLAVLAAVTKNDTIVQYLDNLLYKAMISHQEFYNPDGVLSADSAQQASAEHVSQYMVRGLKALYDRNTTHSDIRNYIREYLGVQYNAVLNNARAPNTDIYAASWTGPPSSNFSFDNQTNALTMLVTAISLQNDTDTTDGGGGGGGGSPGPSGNSGTSKKSPNIGAIAGGVVGGLAFIALMVVLGLYLVRQRRKSQSRQVSSNAEEGNRHVFETPVFHTEPFTTFPMEKSVKRQPQPHSNSNDAQIIDTSTEVASSSSYISPYSPSDSRLSRSNMTEVPTSELVRVLNARLQPGRWREDEMPPDYASARG